MDFSFIQTAGTGTVNISGSYTDTGTSAATGSLNAVGFLLNANTGSGTFSGVDVIVTVPEPTTMALFGLGALGMALRRKISG